eukprot:Rhum_TRINITY_DN22893_c0_g1::Rhum_TRINITY_DN22893_c0_g1_i1::g.176130::m.176130
MWENGQGGGWWVGEVGWGGGGGHTERWIPLSAKIPVHTVPAFRLPGVDVQGVALDEVTRVGLDGCAHQHGRRHDVLRNRHVRLHKLLDELREGRDGKVRHLATLVVRHKDAVLLVPPDAVRGVLYYDRALQIPSQHAQILAVARLAAEPLGVPVHTVLDGTLLVNVLDNGLRVRPQSCRPHKRLHLVHAHVEQVLQSRPRVQRALPCVDQRFVQIEHDCVLALLSLRLRGNEMFCRLVQHSRRTCATLGTGGTGALVLLLEGDATLALPLTGDFPHSIGVRHVVVEQACGVGELRGLVRATCGDGFTATRLRLCGVCVFWVFSQVVCATLRAHAVAV